jgi:hypothetical protein
MNIETKLGLDAFILDKEAHIVINQEIKERIASSGWGCVEAKSQVLYGI